MTLCSSGSFSKPVAIVFDMDGLLLDTEPQYIRAMQRAARELGFELEDNLMIELIGRNNAESMRRLSAALGPGFPTGEFSRRWPPMWEALVEEEGVARKPGVDEMLVVIAQHSLAHAIATSSSYVHADRSLRLAGLASDFATRVTGDQIDNGKPAPDIYLEAARRLQVEPARCLAFEDSEPGLMAAVNAGMSAFMIPDLKPPSPGAASSASGILNSLHDAVEIIVERLR